MHSRSILHTPFIPLIVIFCAVIETADPTDLSRLQDFAASIQPLSNLSRSAEHFIQLAQVLSSIASRFVELRSAPTPLAQTGEENQFNAGFEVDAYLNALGLAPTPTARYDMTDSVPMPPGDQLVNGASAGFLQGEPSELYGWLDDHQRMLDILNQQDLQLLGSNYFQGVAGM